MSKETSCNRECTSPCCFPAPHPTDSLCEDTLRGLTLIIKVKNPPERRKDLALTDFLDPPSAIENPDQYELIKGVLVPKWNIKGEKAEIEWSTGTLEERTSTNGLIRVGRWRYRGQKDPYNAGRTVYHHSGFASCILTKGSDWYQVPGPDGIDIIRQLSDREMLRLQGLPEDLELSGSKTQIRKQIGNAVPPPMVEWIARCLQDQSSHTPTSDIHSTTDIWPHVQSQNPSADDKIRITQLLKNLSQRRLRRKAQRDAQKALEEEGKTLETSDSEHVKARHTIDGGQPLAARTKRLKELDEQIKVLDKVMTSLKMEHKLLTKARPGRK